MVKLIVLTLFAAIFMLVWALLNSVIYPTAIAPELILDVSFILPVYLWVLTGKIHMRFESIVPAVSPIPVLGVPAVTVVAPVCLIFVALIVPFDVIFPEVVKEVVPIPPLPVIFPVLVMVLDVVKDVVPIPPFAVIFPVNVDVPLLLILVADTLPPV